MSETKHTPGPWLLPVYHIQHVPGSTANGQGDWQCYVNPSSNGHQYCPAIGCGPSAEVAKANAQRIVECVNACEGITDPSVVKEFLTLLRELEVIGSQRLACGNDAEMMALDLQEKMSMIRAAITKATGETF